VAPQGRPPRTGSEFHLLTRILSADLIDGYREFWLFTATPVHVAMKALLLFSEITRDDWWCRAWTFQENYRGGTQMALIRHDPFLEPQKRRHRVCIRRDTGRAVPTVHHVLHLALRGAAPLDAKRIDSVVFPFRILGEC
jgi:hypothetical protein